MHCILFVCTGNYYRSRFAEILFNHFARIHGLNARAFSRGFRLNPGKNKGDISPHAIAYLSVLNIPLPAGTPAQLESYDLEKADKVILLDEKEHRPMIRSLFPDWEQKVEYWNFEDDYITSPEQVLPSLKSKVEMLVGSRHFEMSVSSPQGSVL